MNFVSERRGHRLPMGVALIALTLFAVLALATRAHAAENIYWDNYNGPTEGDSVSFSDITGAGGGTLNLGGAKLDSPEGMAYDTVTNRLFVGSGLGEKGQILAINLDGSGASAFAPAGATIEEPEGVVVDPATRMIYWVNTEGTGSIGWAKLDGSAAGLLNTSGATLSGPYRIGLDPVGGRVYWDNTTPNPDVISYANANNSGGGGNLNLTGAPAPTFISGFSVDPAGGRLYWIDETGKKIGFASLAPGGNGGEVNLAGAPFKEPYGLAFDPSIGRLYWGNYGNNEERANALGFVNFGGGGGGGVSPATATVHGPQDPLIIKSPTGTGAPAVTRDSKERAKLSCSTGSWAADFPGSFVYQAPRTYAYQWSRNGKAIAGATATTYRATKAGSYTCTVTAANQTGSASQTSAGLKVKAAKVKLTTKKKAKTKPGKTVTFKVKAVNQGDIKSNNAKVCVKLPKAAEGGPESAEVQVARQAEGSGQEEATLKIKVEPSAGGTYKVTFQVKGSPGKAAKAKIIVS